MRIAHPYSMLASFDDLAVTCGQAAIGESGEVLFPGDLLSQTDRIIQTADKILRDAGMTRNDLERIVIFSSDVNKRRRQSIYYAGITSGMGGWFLIFGQIGLFEDSVVGGRGFIAIAAVIFGGWTLRGTIAGCIVFAGALSFRLSVQGLGYEVNSELLQSLPFIVTLAGMAVFAHRVRPPAALARPFVCGLK